MLLRRYVVPGSAYPTAEGWRQGIEFRGLGSRGLGYRGFGCIRVVFQVVVFLLPDALLFSLFQRRLHVVDARSLGFVLTLLVVGFQQVLQKVVGLAGFS